MRFVSALLILAVFAAAAVAAERIEVYPDSDQSLEALNAGLPASEYGLHPYDDSSYGESWFFVAYDRSGNSVWALVSISNYHPFKKFAGSVDLSFYDSSGKTYSAHGEYDREHSKAELNRLDVAIGSSRIYGRYPTYFFRLKEGDIEFDLKFEARLPSAMTGGSRLYFDNRKRFWADAVLAPYAAVSGTVTVGGARRSFDGYGYADHGYATIKVPSFSRRWHIMRAFDGHNTINYMSIDTKDRYEPRSVGHILFGRDGKIYCNSPNFTLTPVRYATEPRSGFKYAAEYRLHYRGPHVELDGTVKVDRIVEAVDVFRILSAPVRAVAKTFYSNAWQFRYMGSVDIEVKQGGQTFRFRAPCVGEEHFY